MEKSWNSNIQLCPPWSTSTVQLNIYNKITQAWLSLVGEEVSGRCQQVIDRVVVRSRSQIVKQYALFVVFLGIEWAHDIVKLNSIMNSWVFLAPKCLPFFFTKSASGVMIWDLDLTTTRSNGSEHGIGISVEFKCSTKSDKLQVMVVVNQGFNLKLGWHLEVTDALLVANVKVVILLIQNQNEK